jgi:hypothetical protein
VTIIIIGYSIILVAVVGFSAWNYIKDMESWPSVDALCKGVSLIGIQGAGKTYMAMLYALYLIKNGHRFCWLTTQGERQCRLIDYIPVEHRREIELFAPYRDDSKGFNWLKCYTDKPRERELKVQFTVQLLRNLSDNVTDNMEYAAALATKAVLEYSRMFDQEVTLYDVMWFVEGGRFREHILSSINNELIATKWEKLTDVTLEAVSRKFGSILDDPLFVASLCYTKDDSLDFKEMFGKVFICDFPEDNLEGLGKNLAITLAQAIMIQFNLLASTRHNKSPFYGIICDEFYRYAKGIEPIFQDFPDLHRQRRMGLCLIWQRFNQMSKDLVNVALSCANKYYMMISPEDDSQLSSMETYKEFKGKFAKLRPREYLAFIEIDNQHQQIYSRTRDMPGTNEHSYDFVVNNCRSKLRKERFQWWFTNSPMPRKVYDRTTETVNLDDIRIEGDRI